MSLARDVTTVGGATLLSRLLGFLRDVLIAALLGAGALADAYFAALQIPNLFRRLLAEGALNAAFVPMWLRIRERDGAEGARRFGENVLGLMILGLGALALAGIVFAPVIVRVLAPGFEPESERLLLAADYARLSIPYIAIAGMVAVAAAVLNAEGRVGAAALGIVIFNGVLIAVILGAIAAGASSSAMTGLVLAGAVVLAGLAQLLLVGAALIRLPLAPRRPRLGGAADARKFFALAIPGLLAAGIPQLKLITGAMVASPSEAGVSWLYYTYRLYELPLGVVSIAIASAIVPAIAASVRAADGEAMRRAQSTAFEIALGLSLPAALALALLAHAIAGALFERGAFSSRDTAAVAAALAAICAGLPGHALEKVLGAVSFAHEDTRTPMLAALAGLATALAGALLLFPAYGHVGVAAAIAISGWVGASLLAVVLARRRWLAGTQDLGWRLTAIVLATTTMGLALGGAKWLLAAPLDGSTTARIGALAVLVTAGLGVYGAVLALFGLARLKTLFAAVRDRP
jgi:putative peptidoglycan lipid II flippase